MHLNATSGTCACVVVNVAGSGGTFVECVGEKVGEVHILAVRRLAVKNRRCKHDTK